MDDRRYEELNGCYAMLCEALRAWHRMQKDHPRETAAKVLKDVYGYEFHLNGGGCPWRLPSVDHEWATNGMRALGLPADRFEDNAIVLARLLDGQSGDYELASGRMPETPDTAYGSDADRFVVVEQFHNAFRRITTDWDSVLNRRTMDSNLERLLPLAAHTVRIEREGGSWFTALDWHLHGCWTGSECQYDEPPSVLHEYERFLAYDLLSEALGRAGVLAPIRYEYLSE